MSIFDNLLLNLTKRYFFSFIFTFQHRNRVSSLLPPIPFYIVYCCSAEVPFCWISRLPLDCLHCPLLASSLRHHRESFLSPFAPKNGGVDHVASPAFFSQHQPAAKLNEDDKVAALKKEHTSDITYTCTVCVFSINVCIRNLGVISRHIF